MPKHKLTTEERRRGQAKGAETRRAKRDEARQAALERLSGMTDAAVETLERILHSSDNPSAVRAAREVLDRVMGKPRQEIELHGPEEKEPVEIVMKFDHRPGATD